jgi:hypothetical protein
MASTYSTNLAIELIANGEQTGTWGSTTNSNLGTLIEQAISGYVTQAVSTGTDTTITIPNGTTGVARNMFIELTGTGGASTNLIVPANKKLYFIYNNTSSGQVTVKVSGLTGISVANGTKVVLVSNGTDIVSAASYTISNSAVTFSSITDSGLTATRVTYAGTAGLLQDSANLTFSGTILTSTGFAGPLNGTVGATTAATGAFTTLSATGAITGSTSLLLPSTTAAIGFGVGATEQVYRIGNALRIYVNSADVATFSSAGLAVTGTFSSTLGATIQGLTVGLGAGAVASNIAVGASALAANTTGAYLTAIGNFALYSNTTGSFNTAVGRNVLYSNTTGVFNVAVGGYEAGGDSTLVLNTTGSYNTALGAGALRSNSTASSNAAVGYQAGYTNTTGTENLFAGYRAGYLATGSYAVSIGNEAGYNNIETTNGNVFVGYYSGRANTSGTAVVAIGAASLLANTTGSYNTAIGRSALTSNTTASNNTAVGYQAGYGITTGSSNTYIGYAATESAVSVSNEIVVGASITGKGANTAFIGGTSGAYNGANTTTWSVTSDIRIKKNVASLSSGLDVVQALRPVEFDYIENDKHDIGFIAQEYQTVLPAQVVEGADGMLSLNQNLVPYLVKAIQELKARLDAANL